MKDIEYDDMPKRYACVSPYAVVVSTNEPTYV